MTTENPGFVLPPLSQVGIVVKDVRKTMEYYGRLFGVGPFRNIVSAPKKHWVKGEPFPIKLNMAFAPIGPVDLELIEPIDDGPHKWFLDSRGEGLHHLGFIVDNYDAWVNYLKLHGIDILMNIERDMPGNKRRRAAYMQSDGIGGVLIELMER